jgi:ribosomal protein L7Ae-like RNA K-turn-binding protein
LENLADQVEILIANRIVKLIGLSRKSGQCICGYEKVKDWLKKDIAEVLIQSSDGSNREKSRLRTPSDGSFIGWLSSKELGKAFGRENITHCALASGGLTQRIVEDAQRLKGLRIVKDQNSFRKDETSK